MARHVNVGIVQTRMGPDPIENDRTALAACREALERGAQIVCLPELFRSRYFCQSEDAAFFDLAESVPGPSVDAFTELARSADAAIILSLFERRVPGLYHNTAAVLDGQRGYVGKYRKMHIPDDPRFYEKYYFAPGDLGYQHFDTGAARIGVLICWDQWYPEAARLTALRGAEILFYPTAIGWHPEEKHQYGAAQHAAWEVSQRAHAIANGCYVVSVNRTGFEPDPAAGESGGGIQFWGQSFVVAPDGEVVLRLPVDEPAVEVITLDLDRIGAQRHGWPFFRDRRIDSYGPLTRRFIDDA